MYKDKDNIKGAFLVVVDLYDKWWLCFMIIELNLGEAKIIILVGTIHTHKIDFTLKKTIN